MDQPEFEKAEPLYLHLPEPIEISFTGTTRERSTPGFLAARQMVNEIVNKDEQLLPLNMVGALTRGLINGRMGMFYNPKGYYGLSRDRQSIVFWRPDIVRQGWDEPMMGPKMKAAAAKLVAHAVEQPPTS